MNGPGGAGPDRWLVVEVDRPADPDHVGLLVEELLTFPVRGVEELEDGLAIYLVAEGREASEIVDEIRLRLDRVLDAPVDVRFRWQSHQAWEESWKRGLEPRRITSRLVVSPSWVDPELEPGDLLVVVDPGMAFGTAEHPTTRGSLRLLDRLIEPGQRVADVGAGSGILSIAAACLGADEVVALEVDPASCETARENLRRNGVANRVRVEERDVTPDFLPGEALFDGIMANIESGVLLRLVSAFRSGLRGGGWLILSGVLADEAAHVRSAAERAGFRFHTKDCEGGWWSAAFTSSFVTAGDESPSEPDAPRPGVGPTGRGPGSTPAPGRSRGL